MTNDRRFSNTNFLKAATIVTFGCILPAISGCTSSKSKPTLANFTQTINQYFLDHPDCLLSNTRFPFETTDKEQTKQMDSLTKAQLLDKSEEMSIRASRYTPTAIGARFAPRFCFGHREVTSIESFTPVALANGFNETKVTYRYSMKEVPVWAQTSDIVAAFPAMAKATSGEASATITLAQTGVGWQVPD